MTRSSPGAAPWERFQTPPQHDTAVPHSRSGQRSSDNGGISVAELIAKLGGTTTPNHRHAAPETDEPESATSPKLWDRDEIRRVAYSSELPNLDQIHHPHTDGAPAESGRTAVLPAASKTPPPVRGGRPSAAAPAHPVQKPLRRRRSMLLAGRAAAALIAVLALALTGAAWEWSTSKNSRLNQVSALDPDSGDIVDPHGQYGDENFLIVGADTRAGANSDIGAGNAEDTEGARSDTIMLVNIPANRKRVVVVSFPRDLAITPIRCEAWNADTGLYGPVYDAQTGTYGPDIIYTETKLNSTYSFGGPKCLVKEIQKLSGLFINRFIAVDFVGFGRMVDALGGVEVCSTSQLYDYELGTVLDHGGRQVIDGATALNYVRARSVNTEDNGDYGRIKRQQLFLASLLRSLISKDTFLSPAKLNNVVNMFINDSYVDNIKTKDLVALGQSLQGVTAGHVTFVTVPTGETDENGDEPPRMSDVRALFSAIIDDDPLPGENDHNATASPTTTASTPTATQPGQTVGSNSEQVQALTTAPYEVTVRVSNATGELGLAGKASGGLEQRGFNVLSPNDYPEMLRSSTVLFTPGNEQAAATVASAFGNPPIKRVTGTGLGQVVQVVLGADFRSVSAPAPSGSSVSVQLVRGTSTAPTKLPDDLTYTNAADTTCE
jgi:LCP family protein required for cell wall assembly